MTAVMRGILIFLVLLPLGGCLHWPVIPGYKKQPEAAAAAVIPAPPQPAPIGPAVIAVPVEHVTQENLLVTAPD